MGIGLILAIYVIDGIIFGLITQYVSSSKGYEGGFAWGFFLGLIGLLVVGFRPSIETSTSQNKPVYNMEYQSTAQKTQAAMWECSCGEKNPDTLHFCRNCRMPREEHQRKSINEADWVCSCGVKNKKEALFCKNCGNRKALNIGWKCSSCENNNETDAMFCVFCGKDRKSVDSTADSDTQKIGAERAFKTRLNSDKYNKEHIQCSMCGEIQHSNRSKCWKCGREFIGFQGEKETIGSNTNIKGWTCPKCKRANTGEQLSCVECGYQREA